MIKSRSMVVFFTGYLFLIKLFLKMDVMRSPPTHTVTEPTVLLIFDYSLSYPVVGLGLIRGIQKLKVTTVARSLF